MSASEQAPPQQPRTRASSAGFCVSTRIRNRAGFDNVFANGQRHGHPLMALYVLKEATPEPRLGLAVSRKVDPRAVGRNRIKRVLRETFRLLLGDLTNADYVVVARVAAREADGQALKEAFEALLRKAAALPLSPSNGTMPTSPMDKP